jgi:hypothetical protein
MAKPKQDRLPGTEDNRITDLHKAALQYVEVRDERMAKLREEIPLAEKVLELMKKHGKKTYVCDGVSIERVKEEEKVKVRVKKDENEAEEI